MATKARAVKARTKGRFKPPPDETRRERFERIVTARMQRVLNSIRLLGNLAGSNYEYDLEEIQLIKTAISDQLSQSMARFEKAKPKTVQFKLPERVTADDL